MEESIVSVIRESGCRILYEHTRINQYSYVDQNLNCGAVVFRNNKNGRLFGPQEKGLVEES